MCAHRRFFYDGSILLSPFLTSGTSKRVGEGLFQTLGPLSRTGGPLFAPLQEPADARWTFLLPRDVSTAASTAPGQQPSSGRLGCKNTTHSPSRVAHRLFTTTGRRRRLRSADGGGGVRCVRAPVRRPTSTASRLFGCAIRYLGPIAHPLGGRAIGPPCQVNSLSMYYVGLEGRRGLAPGRRRDSADAN